MGKRMDEFKVKVKKATDKTKEVAGKTWNWVKENPMQACLVGSMVYGIAAGSAEKRKKDRNERDELLRIWDPVQGDYLYTRKPLTGRQKLEFETRVQNGQPRAEALHEMKVLDLSR